MKLKRRPDPRTGMMMPPRKYSVAALNAYKVFLDYTIGSSTAVEIPDTDAQALILMHEDLEVVE